MRGKMLMLIHSLLSEILGIVKQRPMVNRLRKWGAIVGNDVELICVNIGRKDATCIEIGSHVTLTYCTILTHDASPQRFVGYGINRVGRVVIGDNVFVGRQSIILPNVKIGSNVIIGAGSIVNKNIPDNVVAAGNPCRVICSIDDFVKKTKQNMIGNTFWNVNRDKMSKEEMKAFNDKIDGKIVYLGKK
jgi:maltose O-acetyltransferase